MIRTLRSVWRFRKLELDPVKRRLQGVADVAVAERFQHRLELRPALNAAAQELHEHDLGEPRDGGRRAQVLLKDT